MQAKFQIYKDKAEKFRFRLVAPNGEPIASSEGYSSKQACKAGVTAAKKYAPVAEVEEVSWFQFSRSNPRQVKRELGSWFLVIEKVDWVDRCVPVRI